MKTWSVAAPAAAGLLGRAEQLVELAGLLEAERLVMLTGAPGIGKTRLALALAEQAGRGALVVELAPVCRPAHVPRAVASALSIDEQPGQSVTDMIVARIGKRRRLVLLDNCEHVLGGCAKMVEALLAGCPQVRILATSRERLGLDAEWVWEVSALAVPHPGEEAPEALAACPAVGLFVERASSVHPGFELTTYVAPSVAEICRRLDGIPLAIELAAARAGVLTASEIARWLDDPSRLLTDTSRDVAHDRTLAAALDWSYELLSPAERALLRRLAVFVGGFQLATAEVVCAGGDVDGEAVRSVLGGLVAKSLVVESATGRYRLLETIRAYAGQRLEGSGEVRGLREAHARFYVALAEEAEPQMTGPAQQLWFERLEAERADMRAAVEWSSGHGRADSALRLTGALVLFWRVRCHFSEGLDLLQAAVSDADRAPDGLRAKALWGLGFLAVMADETDRALPALEASLGLYRQLGDQRGCARALLILGDCRQYRDEPADALLEESAALARAADDSWCLAHALGCAGLGRCQRNDLVAGRALLEECVSVSRAANETQGLRLGLLGLGEAAGSQGDFATAEPLLEEAAAVAEELGEPYFQATALQYLGQVSLGRGAYERAGELLDDSLFLIRQVGPPAAFILPLVVRAQVAIAEGELARARELLEEALPLARSSPHAHTHALQASGDLAAIEGDLRAARRFFEEALDLAESVGAPHHAVGALHGLGWLARADDLPKQAAALHLRALELQREIGNVFGLASSLEAVAGALGAAGRGEQAARLFGATTTIRSVNGYARPAWDRSSFESDLAFVRQSLSPEQFEVAFSAGEALTVDEAVAHAVNGRRPSGRPEGGWQTLTETERAIAALVAEGMTNREVAEALFVSSGTVKNHLSHIFSKLKIGGRVELAQQVSRREHRHSRAP